MNEHTNANDVAVEWGIRHHQGIATCGSQRDAIERLPAFVRRYESNFRNTVEPHIVRREVSAWARFTPPEETS